MAKVRTRKRGKTWSYIFEAGQVNGKRKVIEKGGFATEKEAYAAGVEKYTDFKHVDIGITSEAITLKDFMTKWLDEVVVLNVKPTTMQTYQSFFNNHIFPELGEVKVQELTPAILDNWVRDLQKAGLSFNTISSLHAFIHHALDYAVYPAQLISSNPAAYIKVPKGAPKNIVERHIKRSIVIDDYLIDELKRWQSQQIENKKLFGGTYVYTYLESDGHIIRRSKGLPAPAGEKFSLICVQNNGKLVLREFAVKVLRDEGLNALSFRHTYATRLIENGVISEDVSGRLGHKNSDSTFNVYVHNTPKVQEQFARSQEKLVNIFTKIMQIK